MTEQIQNSVKKLKKTEELLNSLRTLITNGCSDSDLEDFAKENDISVGEVFHQVSIWNAPDCCKGCKNVNINATFHDSVPASSTGFKYASTAEISTVRIIVLFPPESSLIHGRTENPQLRAKLTATAAAIVMFFFVGGMIIAMNIP